MNNHSFHIVSIVLITAFNFSLFAKDEENAAKKIRKNYKEISSIDEYKKILNSDQPTVINYHAPWCDACTQMEPSYDKVAGKYKGKATFYCVNVTHKDFKPLVKERKIEGLPTTTFHKNKNEVRRERGSMSEAETEQITNHFINGPTGFIVEKPQEAKEAAPLQKTRTVAQKH